MPTRQCLLHVNKHGNQANADILMMQEERNTSDQRHNYGSEAYFSTQPPLEPQRLVLVGKLPEHTRIPNKMLQFHMNMTKIDYHKRLEIPSKNPLPEKTEIFPSEISTKPLVLSQSDETLSPSIRKSRSGIKTPYEVSLLLLHQLISNLPVTSSGVCFDTSIVKGDPTYQSRYVQGSRICSPKSQRSSCSIAVQARSELAYTTDDTSRLASVDGEFSSDEWMGGVRALRDSHVRLVQRQLRHIERLNRALDRVTRNTLKGPKQIYD